MSLDFLTLQKKVEIAARKAFSEVREKHSGDEICGYALYSDASAMSVSPAANSKSHLEDLSEEDPDDADYYRWSTGEWAYEFEGADYFKEASEMLQNESKSQANQSDFENFKLQAYEACVRALETLKEEGFFAKDKEDIVILFTLSDAEIPTKEIEWVERLNSQALSDKFKQWIASL